MKQKNKRIWLGVGTVGVLAAAGLALALNREPASHGSAHNADPKPPAGSTVPNPESLAMSAITAFAQENGLSPADYPESVAELLERNPETLDFVLHYPMEHGKQQDIDMSEFRNADTVPLFLQWDRRWGYIDYGADVAGITGCGPVCLAMAGYYLTGSEDFRPDNVLRFAMDNGYYVSGSGSSWTLISKGGEKLGLAVTELPLVKGKMEKSLEAGYPIICAMGPGDFTTAGHYIVLTGMEDGKFRVNDPNSRERSARLWSYDEIASQIRNLWELRV